MEFYEKGETVEHECRLPFNIANANYDPPVAHVKANSRLQNLMGFAHAQLNGNSESDCLVFEGSGNACSKAISFVEVFRRQTKLKNLYQQNKIQFKKIDELWEPTKEGLDRLKVSRDIPSIFILLSRQPLGNIEVDKESEMFDSTNTSAKRPRKTELVSTNQQMPAKTNKWQRKFTVKKSNKTESATTAGASTNKTQ